MNKAISTLFILALFFFSSCGQSYDAKSKVKKFMKEQMGVEHYDVLAWSNIDSTHHVKDSLLQVMHATALKDKIVKNGTKYQPRTDKLNIITLRYAIDKDTIMSTFYFDDQLTGIVAVKRDGMKQ